MSSASTQQMKYRLAYLQQGGQSGRSALDEQRRRGVTTHRLNTSFKPRHSKKLHIFCGRGRIMLFSSVQGRGQLPVGASAVQRQAARRPRTSDDLHLLLRGVRAVPLCEAGLALPVDEDREVAPAGPAFVSSSLVASGRGWGPTAQRVQGAVRAAERHKTRSRRAAAKRARAGGRGLAASNQHPEAHPIAEPASVSDPVHKRRRGADRVNYQT